MLRALSRRVASPLVAVTLAVATLAVAPLSSALPAQGVLVAPQGIPIDHRARSGSFEVYNPGRDRVEVAVSLLYGHPVSDSAGRTTILTSESPAATEPSAASWISAYPRRLVLGPGERQTIRLFARPPQGLADGEYWTRVVVSARAAAAPVMAADSAVHAGIALEVRTIIAAWYRKGALSTGLVLDSLPATLAARDTVALRPWLRRTGTAAYIGTLRSTLEDSTGRRMAEWKQQLAVYTTLSPRIALTGGAPLAPGRYRLRLDISDDREDLRRDQRVPGAPVSRVVDVVVPRVVPAAAPTAANSASGSR